MIFFNSFTKKNNENYICNACILILLLYEIYYNNSQIGFINHEI